MIARCVLCGCTEERACPGGCAWRPGFARIGIPLCTACTLTLTVPMPPNIANARWPHWGTKQSAWRSWRNRALVLEPWLVGRRPQLPLERARLEATLILSQQMDEDNAVARLKWALDLLVERGWLVDDAPTHLDLAPVRQLVDRHQVPRVLLTLTDLAAAPAAGRQPERLG